MDQIAKLFISSYETFDPTSVSIYYEEEKPNYTITQVHGGKYMSRRVFSHIKKTLQHKVAKEYIFDNTRVTLEMYSTSKNYKFQELVNLLNYYVYTLNKIVHRPVVKVLIYLSNLKKLFPKDTSQVLNEDNCNSGVTMFNGDERVVIVYRKEEVQKVLLHELIHFYGIDFHFYNKKYDEYFIENFGIQVVKPYKNINNPLALYEAYTDTLACYGHIVANCLFKADPAIYQTQNSVIIKTLIQNTLKKEKAHYMQQAGKLYKYGSLCENTHCFAYYICKAAVFKHFHKFISLINNNGLRMDTEQKQNEFLDLLKDVLGDKQFWKSIENTRSRALSLNSLRMSKLQW